jgi:hypothetical protein
VALSPDATVTVGGHGVIRRFVWRSRVLQGQPDDRSLAFVHVTVIDGTGAAPKPNQTVVIARDRIETVGDFSRINSSSVTRIVDGAGPF